MRALAIHCSGGAPRVSQTEPGGVDVPAEQLAEREGFRRSRFTGRFLSREVERSFNDWHRKQLRPRVIALFIGICTIYLAFSSIALTQDHSMKTQYMKMYPSARVRFLVCSYAARSSPLIYAALLILPPTQRLVTKHLQLAIIAALLGALLLENVPLLLDLNGSRSDGTFEPQLLPNCSIHAEDPAIAVRGGYWHATNGALFMFAGGGLSGLHAVPSLFFCFACSPAFHLSYTAFWRATGSLRGPSEWRQGEWEPVFSTQHSPIPIYFWVLPIFGTVLFALLQENSHREEYRYRHLLQLANAARIEQLQQEKESLDWDRRLRAAVDLDRTGTGPAHGPDRAAAGGGADHCAAERSYAEHGDAENGAAENGAAGNGYAGSSGGGGAQRPSQAPPTAQPLPPLSEHGSSSCSCAELRGYLADEQGAYYTQG